MRESKGYQLILRETTIKHIVALLKMKFPSSVVNASLPAMKEITDLRRLDELHLAAAQVPTFEAFAQMLHE